EGDVIIVSGTMGDHHCTILSHRLNIESDMQSDNAPLVEMTAKLVDSGIPIHTMRDVTRGGLGTVLKELAESSGKTFYIDEESIPVSEAVKDFAKLMGTDVMYMGNEGKMVLTLPAEYSDKALELIKSSRYGENAAVIGEVKNEEKRNKKLIMRTMLGGERSLDILRGEGLPRIC
ncbi:MAG: hydrogenase expression/formation protein HypE, partial [Lachnospiraceae bacterium]|nr:hydrogenase expression/formation protein HypE [Lachnospiraceae bacterium]